jgi:hypothetical protein
MQGHAAHGAHERSADPKDDDARTFGVGGCAKAAGAGVVQIADDQDLAAASAGSLRAESFRAGERGRQPWR